MAAIKSTPFAMHRPPLVWIRQAGGEGPSHAAAGGSTLRVDLERERERLGEGERPTCGRQGNEGERRTCAPCCFYVLHFLSG